MYNIVTWAEQVMKGEYNLRSQAVGAKTLRSRSYMERVYRYLIGVTPLPLQSTTRYMAVMYER